MRPKLQIGQKVSHRDNVAEIDAGRDRCDRLNAPEFTRLAEGDRQFQETVIWWLSRQLSRSTLVAHHKTRLPSNSIPAAADEWALPKTAC